MHTALKQTTPPSTEPITLAEAKLHLRVVASDDDTLINTLIAAARKWAEDETDRQLLTGSWRLDLDGFPPGNGTIYLPRCPVQSVTTLKYYDTAGVLQTLAATKYQVSTDSEPGRVAPAYGETWPAIQSGKLDAVQIVFAAGYGAAADVPALLKAAMLLKIGQWYEHREELVAGVSIAQLPAGGASILQMFQYGQEFTS